MDLTLGLAMSATSVRFLLAEGLDGCGATLEHDEFEVSRAGGVSAPSISEHVVAVVLGTQAIATAQNHTLQRVGVTWTQALDTEASLVLESLNSLGIRNVVPVPMLDAAEAFACDLVKSYGSYKTAVFTMEQDSAVAALITCDDGDICHINSQVYKGRFMPGEARRSLAVSMFSHLTYQPDVVFVAESGGDFDWIVTKLEEVSELPVKEPAESQFALARGAAIASKRPALEIAWPGGGPTGETSFEDADELQDAEDSTSDDGLLLPLLFVPRTARLAMLESPPKIEAAPAFAGLLRNGRAVTSTHVLTAAVIGAVATFLVSTTLAFSDKTATSLSSSSPSVPESHRLTVSASSPPQPIGQPDGLATAGQPEAQAAQPLFIPGLNGLSLSAPASAPAAPPPASSPPPATAPTTAGAPKSPAAPDVVGMLLNLFSGPSANPSVLAAPTGPQPLGLPGLPLNAEVGADSPVAALYEPLRLAISDPAKIAIPDVNLPAPPNPAGGQ